MKALLLFLLFSATAHASEVPAYLVRVGLEPASKIPRWLVELVPPPGHHFNLSAPMKVESKGVTFRPELKEDRILGFAASSIDLTENDTLSTSAFLCDDAKTYCVKKSVVVSMKVDPTLQTLQKQKRVIPRSKKSAKDKFGFWVQDPEAAVREALNTGKPILIDFFGVWCPPCNLYEELVFLKPGFQKAMRKFVLLRMDADQESSFELKSKLKVGGYPTLILGKVGGKGHGAAGDSIAELGRVVGFLPEQELIARLSEISKFRTESLDDRIYRQKQELFASLRLRISQELEAQNTENARKSLDQALVLFPESAELKVLGILVRALDSGSFQWREDDSQLIAGLLADSKAQESRVILSALGLFSEYGSKLPESGREKVFFAVSELRNRVDSKHLSIPGLECSLADLDVLEMEIAAAFMDQKRSTEARKNAIGSYERLMLLQKNPDSRGLNLELAGLLVMDGQFSRALAIYEKFIKKFPKEFTFHLGAAKAHLEMSDLKSARTEAEQAVRFAYGDNLIRSMDRLLKIMQKQGESAFALRRGEDFLKTIHVDPTLKVRTGRYVSALNSTLSELRKEKTKP